MNYIRGESQNKQVAVVVHKGQVITASDSYGLTKWEELDQQGDTAILLSAMPMLKYCDKSPAGQSAEKRFLAGA